MNVECILCEQQETVHNRDSAYGLEHMRSEDNGIVCSQCVKSKLDSGRSDGSCIHCFQDPDYRLKNGQVELTLEGTLVLRVADSAGNEADPNELYDEKSNR